MSPPGRDIRCNATFPWGENLHHPIVGEGKPPATFPSDTCVRLDNDTAQPSTQRASSIRSTHGKYNPFRALINGLCLLSTIIFAFRNCFWLNWSDASDQSSSYASLPGLTERIILAVGMDNATSTKTPAGTVTLGADDDGPPRGCILELSLGGQYAFVFSW